MKKHIWEFLRRGVMACGLGPLILAILYATLHQRGIIETLSVHEVCVGIVSLSVLAFIAGGMNCIYQVERLPLMVAILIHGAVLYISYLGTYLINGWLARGITPFLVFTGIFIIAYPVIWMIVYLVNKKKIDRINEMLKQKQKTQKR